MKSQHPNFCRQFLKQYQPFGFVDASATSLDLAFANASNAAFHLASDSQKFILPDGGRMIVDGELKALDDSVPLRLPYPSIALEYFHASPCAPGETLSTKRIAFVTEYDDLILILPVSYIDKSQTWQAYPEVAIQKTGYLDRTKIVKGNVTVNFVKVHNSIPDSDYVDEVSALLCFLNALQCSNVHVERSEGPKVSKIRKDALPFDDYHVLVIELGGSGASHGNGAISHRSPREHLRRGHIRRIESGRKIWVNAAVVGAGKGAGKITKDYAIA